MSTYKVTDEVAGETYQAETPESAVDQFLDTGYDTGDLKHGAEFCGLVWDAEGKEVASWKATANGDGGVESYKVTTY